MPKLIIKREPTPRFIRKNTLFWAVALFPLAVTAGFLAGTLLGQFRMAVHPGHPGIAPPTSAPSSVAASPADAPTSPTLRIPALPIDTHAQGTPLPTTPNTVAEPQALLPPLPTNTPYLPTAPLTDSATAVSTPVTASPPASLLDQAKAGEHQDGNLITKTDVGITKNQDNIRSHPAKPAKPNKKAVKSQQRKPAEAARPVARRTARRIPKPVSNQDKAAAEKEDYRLLEQSLGIPLN